MLTSRQSRQLARLKQEKTPRSHNASCFVVALQRVGSIPRLKLVQITRDWWCHTCNKTAWKDLLGSWGEQGWPQRQSKMTWEKKGTGALVFTVFRGWGLGQGSCSQVRVHRAWTLAPGEGMLRVSYQLAQMWGKRGKKGAGLKAVSSKTSKVESQSLPRCLFFFLFHHC